MTEQTILKIEGMSCDHCKNYVSTILSTTFGVVKNWVRLEESTAEISFDNTVLSREQLVDLINQSNYYKAN